MAAAGGGQQWPPPRFQAHHVIPREVGREPGIKEFLDKIGFKIENGAKNGVMLPPGDAGKALSGFENAAIHMGSNRPYSAAMSKKVANIMNAFNKSAQTSKNVAEALAEVEELANTTRDKLLNGGFKTVNEVL